MVCKTGRALLRPFDSRSRLEAAMMLKDVSTFVSKCQGVGDEVSSSADWEVIEVQGLD